MTDMTPARLAELRAVAEAATLPAHYVCDCTALCGGVCPNPKPVYLSIDNETVLALIDALGAANESKPSNSVTSGSANERELADLRAEVDGLADDGGHKAAKYWKWWQREKARADRAEAALARIEAWAFEEEDFTDSVSPDYREGFRDAQKVTLGLVQAWGETGAGQ